MRRISASIIIFLSTWAVRAQCTYSCSSYVLSPITFSMYEGGGDTLEMLDDEVTTTLPLHFNFEFYCNTYNQVRICSNGFITFDFTNIVWGNTPYAQSLPTATVPNAVIAWNWNDLDPSQGGTVTYTTTGTSPNMKFIVTYSDVPLWTPVNPPSSLRNTGQIVLHETTNIIEVHVKEATNNGWLLHTSGIEDPSASLAVTVPGRNLSLWTASLSSFMFSPYDTGPAPTVQGDTALCEGTLASYAATTVAAAQGYHWSFPPGWTYSGTQASITAIAGASGNVSVAAIYTCGNSAPAVMAVSVTPAPVVSVTASGPATLCSNSFFTLQPTGADFYTLVPGQFTGSSGFTLQPAASTVYSLSGADSTGCLSLKTATASVTVFPSPTITVNSGSICLGSSFTMVPSGASQYTFSSHFPVVTPQQSGVSSYTVISKASNNCVSQPAISNVTVHALPSISVTADRGDVCANEHVTLTATGATSYTWLNVSGQSPTVQIKPFITFVYHVAGIDQNGCRSTSSLQVKVDPCLDLADVSPDQQILFPNPASDFFYFAQSCEGSFQLTDVTGRKLMDGPVPCGDPIAIGMLPEGVYLVSVSQGGQHFLARLVKVR